MGRPGAVVAGSWAALVAARLARFNATTNTDRFHFVGIPCPIAAVIVSQYVIFSGATWGDYGSPWVCAGIIVVLGALMLSRVPYWSSATLLPGQFFHHTFGPGLAATALFTIPFPRQAIFVGTAASVTLAATLHLARRLSRRPTVAPAIAG